MDKFIEFFKNIVFPFILDNGMNWLITALITFIAVSRATRQYYIRNRIEIVNHILELCLRSILILDFQQEIPDNAKVIFVEYKGRNYKRTPKNKKEQDCKFGEKVRKTVTDVGGNTHTVSKYRPRDYGILGVANELMAPVVFDFKKGILTYYHFNKLDRLDVETKDDKYFYQSKNGNKFLSNVNTDRDIMIAVPIINNRKLIGGITFDIMAIEGKTVYTRLSDNGENNEDREKNNYKVMKNVLNTAKSLVYAYFNKKGDNK